MYVKKGDLLVSSTIHKDNEIMDYTKVDGKILGETWYRVDVSLPNHYYEEKKTNNENIALKLNIFNKEINLFKSKKFKEFVNTNIYKYKTSILPFSIDIIKEKEITTKDYIYTQDNCFMEANKLGIEKLKNMLGDIEIIFNKKLKIEEINSKIRVVIFYKVIEDITEYQEIR